MEERPKSQRIRELVKRGGQEQKEEELKKGRGLSEPEDK